MGGGGSGPGALAGPRSCTESLVFELAKYSRCRPRGAGHKSRGLERGVGAEWTHFTQPKLVLIVETSHSDRHSLAPCRPPVLSRTQSIGLKVVWDNNSQAASANPSPLYCSRDADDVFVLEHIDLNQIVENYSNPAKPAEVPLKAVCKDGVAGLRYAIGYQAEAMICNRFQVRFRQSSDCLKFMEKIESICPCRIEGGSSLESSSQKHGVGSLTSFDQSPLCSQYVGAGNHDRPLPDTPEPSQQLSGTVVGSRGGIQQGQSTREGGPVGLGTSVNQLTGCIQSLASFPAIPAEPVAGRHSLHLSPPPPPLTTNPQPHYSSHQSTLHHLPTQVGVGEGGNKLSLQAAMDLDDESLKRIIRDICLEPGFEDLTKRVKRFVNPTAR